MISLFVWNNALLLLLAIRLPQRLLPGAPLEHRMLASLLCFPAIVILAILATAGVGHVTASTTGGLITAAAALEWILPSSSRRVGSIDPAGDAAAASRTETALRAAGACLLAGFALLWISRTAVSGTGFRFDDLTYHATSSAWWLRQASLSLPPFTYQSYYPHDAELLNLWFMLPLRGDAHANLAVLVWIALAASALLAIARSFAGSRGLALLSAACLLASPQILFFAGSFTASDLCTAGSGLAALAFAHVRRGSDPRTQFGSMLLCGLAAGIAVGAKASMIAPMGLLAGWCCWRAVAGERSRRIRPGELAAFAFGLAATAGFWYVRNWILTGNPLFPAEIGPFAGPFDRATQWRTTTASFIAARWQQAGFWRSLLYEHLDWPLPLGLLSMSGYVLALGAAGSSRRFLPSGLRAYAVLLAAAGLLAIALLPLQPFSATINRPTTPLHYRVRYLGFAIGVGLALYGSLGPRRPWATLLLSLPPVVAIAAAMRSLAPGDGVWIGAGAAGAALFQIAWAIAPGAFTGRRMRTAAYAALAAALVALALWTPVKARRTAENLYSFRVRKTHQATPGWAALERLPAGSRVASVSFSPASHALYYPVFGRSLQFDVVAIDPEGRRRPPLHERRDLDRGWWWEFEVRNRVPSDLLANLRAAGVDYLFVSRWPRSGEAGPWPPARGVLQARVPEQRIYGDGHSEIWDLRRASIDSGARAPGDEDPIVPYRRERS